MDVSTYIRTSTTVRLDADEQFDMQTGHAGRIRVTRLIVHTNLQGKIDGWTGVIVDGVRYKQDGTLGKAPASSVYLYDSDLPQVPEALLEAVRVSVLAEAVERGGVPA